jgi:signal transduction histidine kinase
MTAARRFMTDLVRSLSLKTRVLLLVAALFVVGIWGLAARTTAVLQTDLEQLLSEQLATTVGYIAADLDRKFKFRIDTMNQIAASITPDILADPVKVQRLLERSNFSIALFPAGFVVANKQGTYIADYPRNVARAGGAFIGDRKFFREVIGGAKLAISEPLMARYVKKPVVVLAVPLHDASGAIAGALAHAVSISDPDLFGLLEQTDIGKGGILIVASPRDRLWVTSNDPSRTMQPLPTKGLNPILDRRMEEGFEGAVVTTASYGVKILALSRNMKTTGWAVIASVPASEIFAPVAALKRQIYLAALLISLLIALVLRFALVRQLAPLEQAGAAMRRMTEGEAPLAPLPVIRNDEIGRLLGNFNRLAAERMRLEESLRKEIIERKRAEAEVAALNEQLEVRIAERTRELETFNYSVSHDLKAPLRGIEGYSRLLLEEYADKFDEQGRQFLRNVRDATRQMNRLLNDLAAYSRLERRELHAEPVDLQGLVQALLIGHAEEIKARGAAVNVTVPVAIVGADRDGLATALRNLLENALKFTRDMPNPKIEIGGRDTGDSCILWVRDNGIGFDMKFHDKIFAIFQRLHRSEDYPGTGVGLAIVKKTMERMGGRVWAESEPGKGATFYLEIPK